jgi:hypothetical protein
MRKTIYILIIAATMSAFMSSLFMAGNPAADKSAAAVYEDCINKHISRYLLKEHLYKKSRFEQLRKRANQALKRAAFLWANKDRLIVEMAEQGVRKQHYHIQVYLNKKFNASRQKENRVAYRVTISNK